VTGSVGAPPRDAATAPIARSRDFTGSVTRLLKRLAPQRRLVAVVMMLGSTGTAISVVVPRILGHATDLLFNGVIGRQRRRPATR
jgi:ATP-binding cassette subfamily B protein